MMIMTSGSLSVRERGYDNAGSQAVVRERVSVTPSLTT